jgi:aspartyl aminopeptidase
MGGRAFAMYVRSMTTSHDDRHLGAQVTQMLADLEASPTPYHAVERATELLTAGGFTEIDLDGPIPASGRHVLASGGLLVAWATAERSEADRGSGFVIVGAHTDSPNLRVRTHPDGASAGWEQIGMEVYGGILANSWLDRDLGLAGRVLVTGAGGVDVRLIREDRPVLRIPQLAIHLDREIRETGLLVDPQKHMVPLWARGPGESGTFRSYVADLAGVAPDDIVSWDLMAHDTQAPAIVGRDGDLIASARIDNLFSTFCGVHALIAAADQPGPRTPVLVLYDHEEVGSESATGAGGAVLANVLERISAAAGAGRVEHLEALARSYVVSADGAHATHPNYVDKHEPSHLIEVNGGVVVKRNANQRYASDALSEAPFRAACAAAGVPVQTYIHRNDLPCGSTIGPITAARLGVPTVDVGAPQLAMHSIRECAGTADIGHLTRALTSVWRMG